MAYHLLTSPILKHKSKSFDDIPKERLIEWSYKLYILMNLAWDYVDTICDCCISMKLSPTKKLVRAIRHLKAEYDRFRSVSMDQTMVDNETEHAQTFEEYVRSDIRKLNFGLEHEISKLDLTKDHKWLVLSVQHALTLMDSVKIYAQWCDKQIASYGVWACDCCLVQTEFLRLFELVPQFAGDCYQPNIKARKLTAKILVNRIMKIPVNQIAQ